mmetsp:Transcript_83135/g.238855  ORF Transcript_83135/g.238855 Transcript_83135/m.238855 type:complete len:212 (+) Transcript_83135:67-702(+)|eukprot:CAMPEP_0177181134 /NCGR_PEP_ID=MMETSP0367-20130122/15762_1 /TAXON_ID=447022 ORGANISM="Scrippsiella hangoei-like, Strain SHHI-4" /NCGR_SAMPLE_ID=MMETSP0367 /ASSEMBLY_ACC=CAM_ASM_000362 /LENGTH=211 /DNA_ID=CAMNT_0018627963 /DNA_START=63 /DNA_END=698 /DNA_ORIENTATION=+
MAAVDGSHRVEVSALSGNSVASLQLAQESSVKALKLRLQKLNGVKLFCQQLAFESRLLENSELLVNLPNPLEVTMVVLSVDAQKGYELMEAAVRGDAGWAEHLLQERADVECTDDGKTSLQQACGHGHVEIARLLCEAGADVNFKAAGDATPLMHASHHGYLGAVKFLVRAKAQVNVKDNCGMTALYFAVEGGSNDTNRVARYLRSIGARE